MIEGLSHVGTDHKCNVCQCDFTDDEGGVQGYFGILPVAFCPTCFASMCDMIDQFDDREWEGLTDEEIEIVYALTAKDYRQKKMPPVQIMFAKTIQEFLKEKNYERT